MIASLRGKILALTPTRMVIECAGIGHEVLISPRTAASLRQAEEVMVLTRLVVRDDALVLYGFKTEEDRAMFDLLQTVSGLGPKLALATLGTLSAAEVSVAVDSKDSKTLQSVPGVGKRMAEKMLVELSGKVSDYLPANSEQPTHSSLESAATHTSDQVVEALVGLGFTERVARPVAEGVISRQPEIGVVEALRASLSALGRS